jgi:hypothetical protein
MDRILEEASREVDAIVVDSPPSLVADYQVLATKMDGVIMIVRPGFTHADAAAAMLEQLGRVNARTVGVVLNKIQRHNYYYPYKGGEYYNQQVLESQPVLQVDNSHIRESLPQTKSQPAELPVQKVEAPVQLRQVPATQNVVTKPRPRAQPVQSVQSVRYVYSETEQEESRFAEANEYVIKNYKLDYWVGSEHANRSDEE